MEPITTILIGVCVGLGIGLFVLYSKYSSRSSQLEREKATHTRQLTETHQQLNEAEEQRDDLSQQNKKTRWILYLSMVSLQGTGVVLLEEQKKRTDLHEKYIDLHKKYIKVIHKYKAFREDVKSKAARRLLKKGGEVILSFIPGLTLILLLSDMGEILDAVSAADVLGEFAEISEDSAPDITCDGLPSSVQDEITNILQQNMNMDNADAELKSDVLNTFAVPSVRKTKDFIESDLAEEYPDRVTLDDLEEFIDELFEYRQTMRDMKENPPPTEEGNLE